MHKVFTLAKGWKIFSWIFLPLLMGLFIWLGIWPFVKEDFNLTLALVLSPFSAVLTLLMVYGLLDTARSKLIIKNNQIFGVGVFTTKVLDVKDIKGFKIGENYLYYIPKTKHQKKIKVSKYFGNFEYLKAWSERQFVNLDKQAKVDEKRQIFENKAFGNSKEQRKQTYFSAKKITKILNTISWIVALSTMFFPYYLQLQIIACGTLPILGLILYRYHKGLIRLDEKPNSIYPNITSTLFMPSCVLLIRALSDITVFDYTALWEPFLIVILTLALLIFMGSTIKYNFKKWQTYGIFAGLLVFASMYSFGIIMTTNFIFDTSKPQVYQTKVLDKRMSSGKNRSFYLTLEKWGPQTEIDDVSVPKAMYHGKEIGDSAVIYFNQGLYQIPYYMVLE